MDFWQVSPIQVLTKPNDAWLSLLRQALFFVGASQDMYILGAHVQDPVNYLQITTSN